MGSCPKELLEEKFYSAHHAHHRRLSSWIITAADSGCKAALEDRRDEDWERMAQTSRMVKGCFKAVAQMCNGIAALPPALVPPVMGCFFAAA